MSETTQTWWTWLPPVKGGPEPELAECEERRLQGNVVFERGASIETPDGRRLMVCIVGESANAWATREEALMTRRAELCSEALKAARATDRAWAKVNRFDKAYPEAFSAWKAHAKAHDAEAETRGKP